MRGYEKLRDIRDEKTKYIIKLRALMKETNVLITKFKTELPQKNTRSFPERFKEETKVLPAKEEIQDIEKDLSDIESKLSNL